MSQPKAQVRLTSIEQIRAHAMYKRATAYKLMKEAERKLYSLGAFEQEVIYNDWNSLLQLIGEEDNQ